MCVNAVIKQILRKKGIQIMAFIKVYKYSLKLGQTYWNIVHIQADTCTLFKHIFVC